VDYRNRIGKSKISGTISGVIKAGMKIIYSVFKYAKINRKEYHNIDKDGGRFAARR
jgi:hypothetical protein